MYCWKMNPMFRERNLVRLPSEKLVTSSPKIVTEPSSGTLYVGDWYGRVYALRASDGKPRWTFTAKSQPLVYSGQIVASADEAARCGAHAHRTGKRTAMPTARGLRRY